MIDFHHEIVAGTVLVIDAIQSPNFVAGTSGWIIRQDGSVEFANATLRGAFEADGANHAYVRIATTGGTGFGTAFLELRPPDLPLLATTVINPGSVFAESNQPSGVNSSYLDLQINGPAWRFASGAPDLRYPGVFMRTNRWDGTDQPLFKITTGGAASVPSTFDIELDGNVTINGKFSRPNCTLSIAENAANAAITTLTPTGAVLDTYGMWDGVFGIDIPEDGLYDLGGDLQYAGQAISTGQRQLRIQVNGVDFMFWTQRADNLNNTAITIHGTVPARLFVNDKVTFQYFQSAGAVLAIGGNSRVWVAQRQNT